MKTWLVGVAFLALGGGRANAETFDQLIDQATTMSPVNVSADYWHSLVDCKRDGDALHRAQCSLIRDARANAVKKERYLVEAKEAIAVGPYSVKNRGLRLAVVGCVDCSRGFEVSGKNYLLTSGPVRKLGTRLIGPVLGQKNLGFENAEAADTWKKDVLPRLVAELIIDTLPKGKAWRANRRRGVTAKVVGFRVYDPCDGSVLVAKPASKRGLVDKSKC